MSDLAKKSQEYLARRRLATARYEANPENKIKVAARKKLRHEVKMGRIVPSPCAKCGSSEIQGHHADYSQPLNVTWLCAKCHAQEHAHGHRPGSSFPLNFHRPLRDLTGQVFGFWGVLSRAPNRGKATYWHCKCKCGVEREVTAHSLVSGCSLGCGCHK